MMFRYTTNRKGSGLIEGERGEGGGSGVGNNWEGGNTNNITVSAPAFCIEPT